MDYKTYIFRGEITALSSISHIGETLGITSKFRREKIVSPDGVVEIPVISGNGMRGLFRDIGMKHMLNVCGIGKNQLSLPAFYFLFSGGTLSKSGRGIDIDEARKWRKLIPLVALFGGAMGNQIMPGKIKMGKLLPIAQETTHILPEKYAAVTTSIWEMLQEEAYTRKDDAKDENMRELLSGEGLSVANAIVAKKEKKGVTKTGQSQQMRYYVETLAAGTKFYWDIVLSNVNDLEFEAFINTFLQFSKVPYICGKSNIGLGKVRINMDKWYVIDNSVQPIGNVVGNPIGTLYYDFLKQNSEDIKKLINELS